MSTLHTDGHYTFKPHLKLGREYKYDGTPLGETYKQTVKGEYERVQRSKLNPVLPGYLSWWGIDISPFYKTESGKRLSHHIEQIRREQYYVPGYLKESTASMYGNNCFSVSFKDLLLSYQRARTDKPGHKMQLKVGGTLLYENEICYVAVICLEGDEDIQLMTAMVIINIVDRSNTMAWLIQQELLLTLRQYLSSEQGSLLGLWKIMSLIGSSWCLRCIFQIQPCNLNVHNK